MKMHKYTRAGLQSPPQHILAPSQITFDAVTILRFIHAEFHFRDQWTMSLSLVFYLSAHLSIYMYSAASHVKSFAVQDTSANSFSSMPLLLPGRTLHHEWLLWDIDRRCWSESLRSANLLILCERGVCYITIEENCCCLVLLPLHFWALTFMGGFDKMTHLDEFIINGVFN